MPHSETPSTAAPVGDNQFSGGQLVADALTTHGVKRIFAVPGESYLAVLDALYDTPQIDLVTCRQEGGAAMMAEAHGKLTGHPGICFVTRGPGATNASAGVHVARQDSTPMILFIGQVGRDMLDREAFQEVDFRAMFGPLAKWVAQIDSAERIPEYISRAFHLSVSGRPGPVVLALPEDMLRDHVAKRQAAAFQPVQTHPGAADIERLQLLIEEAQNPLILLGEGDWNSTACAQITAFAERFNLPVAASFRCQDLFDNTHRCYIGDLGLGSNPHVTQCAQQSDLLLAFGGRLGEIPSAGYTLIESPAPSQRLVHVFPGSDDLNRVFQTELAINAHMQPFAAALDKLTPRSERSADATDAGHASYIQWSTPTNNPGALQMGQVISHLRETLPADAIICNGAGNYAAWVHRYFRYRQFRTQLAPTSGSMGYGLPAAVAAKLEHPDRPVICFAGDGCFQMTMQEFGTAAEQGAAIIVLVVNNESWGTIRMHQERNYPARVKGTTLSNPNFAAFAEAYGGFGAVVATNEEFTSALSAAMQANRPALIEIKLSLEALTPSQSLSKIRAASS